VRFGRREAVRYNRLEAGFLTVLLTSQCVMLRGFYHGGIRVQCTLESVGSNIRAQIQKALDALVLVELVETWFGGVTSALRPVEGDLGFRPSPPSFRAHASDGGSEDSSGVPLNRRMRLHSMVPGITSRFPTFIRCQGGTWRNPEAPQDVRFLRGKPRFRF
jgi:hypothetical protein